ncbi:hypothetical protein SH668x_000250 [Planctomicrobium sp. SH668]|uniref:hypothetical protein n=1 Tax=Planctomicrobium sp. SH668 TaxID=3448126 RepID=UPI003F5BD90F
MEYSGVAVFLFSMIAGRVLTEGALRELTSDKRQTVLEKFSNARLFTVMPIAGLALLFLYANSRAPDKFTAITAGYLVAAIAFLVVRTVVLRRYLSKLQLPESYQRRFGIAQLLSVLGVVWFSLVEALKLTSNR